MADYIIILSSILMIAVLLFFAIKNNNTLKNHIIITDAIYRYKIDCLLNNQEPLVNYDDEEDYDSTLLRFWDWGCKNILSKEKYEIIKPYI